MDVIERGSCDRARKGATLERLRPKKREDVALGHPGNASRGDGVGAAVIEREDRAAGGGPGVWRGGADHAPTPEVGPNPEDGVGVEVALGPRECVGTVAVLGRKVYPAEAVAQGDVVELLAVRAEPVLLAMNDDPALALAFNRALCEQTTMLRSRIDVLSAGAVPQRLATLLLHLAERFGDTDEAGRAYIPLALSRAALSRLVSARVETVIRVASDWQKRGLLATDAAGFQLHDPAALQAIADGR